MADLLASTHAAVAAAMLRAFPTADDTRPAPAAGALDVVHQFGGDTTPLAAWDAHAEGSGCDVPFAWTRLMRRYRTVAFPAAALALSSAPAQIAIAVEVGIGWCAYIPDDPHSVDMDRYATEAAVSADTVARLDVALCWAAATLLGDTFEVALDALTPYGPDGGVIAWSGILYVTD